MVFMNPFCTYVPTDFDDFQCSTAFENIGTKQVKLESKLITGKFAQI